MSEKFYGDDAEADAIVALLELTENMNPYHDERGRFASGGGGGGGGGGGIAAIGSANYATPEQMSKYRTDATDWTNITDDKATGWTSANNWKRDRIMSGATNSASAYITETRATLDSMTEADYDALQVYTANSTKINAALRAGGEITPALEQAMDKLPIVTGTIYRGVFAKNSAIRSAYLTLKPGDVLTEPGISSATTHEYVAKQFATTRSPLTEPGDGVLKPKSIMLHLQSKTSRAAFIVDRFHRDSREVIAKPGTKYKITKVTHHPETGTTIYGHEIDSVTENFNPSHDERGRFTSGGAAGGGLDNGKALADHIAKNAKRGFGKNQLQNIANLNPDGIKGGVIKVPKMHASKVEHIREMLPKGIRIDQTANYNVLRRGEKAAPAVAPAAPETPIGAAPETKEYSEAAKILSSEKVTKAAALGGGCNVTKVVTLANGTKGVWKPKSGEEPGLREGVKSGTYYLREAAASTVAMHTGFHDLVPPTVVREHDGELGSIQQFKEGAKVASKSTAPYDGQKDASRAAAFDYLIGHSDRHEGNWMLTGEKAPGYGKISLIDNGLAFPTRHGGFANAKFHLRAKFHDYEVPKEVKDIHWPTVEKALRDGKIEDKAIELTKQRLDSLKAHVGKKFKDLPPVYTSIRGDVDSW